MTVENPPRTPPDASPGEPADGWIHPCLTCGACCAAFRVSFYWAEPVPEERTVRISPFRAAMAGTEGHPPRCLALGGTIGERVGCVIYADRPSPCREFAPAWEDGAPNPRCDAARRSHGLDPLDSASWDRGSPPADAGSGRPS
ncbi:MAG: YkgJ family cysteine cluster protein [Myxococcota bacterium]